VLSTPLLKKEIISIILIIWFNKLNTILDIKKKVSQNLRYFLKKINKVGYYLPPRLGPPPRLELPLLELLRVELLLVELLRE
jgi:hypothetical protein